LVIALLVLQGLWHLVAWGRRVLICVDYVFKTLVGDVARIG
jgi:hypothetical protein